MRSYQVVEFGHTLRDTDMLDPKPTGDQVVIAVKAAGVCHSDLHIWEGGFDLGGGRKLTLKDRGVQLPLTLGHETAGEILSIGPNVTDRKVGETLRLMGRPPTDRVTLDVARELCLRTGSKAIIAGSVSNLGNQYVIGLNASSCHAGDPLVNRHLRRAVPARLPLGRQLGEQFQGLGPSSGLFQTAGQPVDGRQACFGVLPGVRPPLQRRGQGESGVPVGMYSQVLVGRFQQRTSRKLTLPRGLGVTGNLTG